MKNLLTTMMAVLLVHTMGAQTLNVAVGNVVYQFPAVQAGEMNYSDGKQLTIMGKVFNLSDIDGMTVDESTVTDNLVSISYNGTAATVYVAGNVAQYVAPTVSGAHVSIAQSNTSNVDGDEITYQLSGTAADGAFALDGAYKCTVSLAGLTLTNPNGAAINITNKKRIQLSVKKNTENTLTDGADGSQKGCVYSKGQLQLQGNGTLNVVGNTAHAIKSGDYISAKNLTLNITKAVKDGINCNGYFQMKSGTVTITGVGDDGIQADLDGTASTGETADHEDEDSGNIYIEGGVLTVAVTATAAKCVKSAGDISMTGGTVKLTASGEVDLTDTSDPSYTAGYKADGSFVLLGGESTVNVTGTAGRGVVAGSAFTSKGGVLTVTNSGGGKNIGTSDCCSAKCIKAETADIQGGTISLKATGAGGKCIKTEGTLNIADGTLNAVASGGKYSYSSRVTASAKAVKSTGALTISGGIIIVSSASHEGIETKSTLDISGGYVYAQASDDAINSASHMTITGGYVMANSSGNDGLDANGNLYIKGGNVFAVATSQPEVGIDANTEGGYKLYITGGNVVAIGGFENNSSISGGTAKQASSYTKGSWYALYNGSTVAFAFKVPSNSKMGSAMAVYTANTPALKQGVTGSGNAFWDGNGYSDCSGGSSVSLTTYSGGGGGGPGGGGSGGGGWHW